MTTKITKFTTELSSYDLVTVNNGYYVLTDLNTLYGVLEKTNEGEIPSYLKKDALKVLVTSGLRSNDILSEEEVGELKKETLNLENSQTFQIAKTYYLTSALLPIQHSEHNRTAENKEVKFAISEEFCQFLESHIANLTKGHRRSVVGGSREHSLSGNVLQEMIQDPRFAGDVENMVKKNKTSKEDLEKFQKELEGYHDKIIQQKTPVVTSAASKNAIIGVLSQKEEEEEEEEEERSTPPSTKIANSEASLAENPMGKKCCLCAIL